MIEARATVIEVGPLAWSEEAVARAEEGDKVLITKFAGVTAVGVKDGVTYRLINDRDIFCRIED
jgi:co-chaperonin GroES (HSP10)